MYGVMEFHFSHSSLQLNGEVIVIINLKEEKHDGCLYGVKLD